MNDQTTLVGVQDWMVRELSDRLGLDVEEIDIREPFLHYGLDSAEAVILSGDLADWLGLSSLSPTVLWDYPCISDLAEHLMSLPELRSEEEQEETKSLQEMFQPRYQAATSEEDGADAVAIVGIGCRFPGAHGPDAYWQLLQGGIDAITEVPASRWDADAFYHADPQTPGKMNTRWGGFLPDIDRFDAAFFGIAAREAARMDPQQRVLLETAWEALEDGGVPPSSLAGSKTGVFIGISTHDYYRRQFSDPTLIDAYAGTGNSHSIAANRLSYLLDLRGPSVALDTACSSSLVAVHLACQSLRSGESQVALAGGVNLVLDPDVGLNFAKAGAMAADGRCKTFDAAADGYVRSEGVGIVVLKPLSQALEDGDRLYAVIRGTAINQDGRSNGLMAPNGQAQESCLREAYLNAGISPGRVHYMEAHGTGTALGDPIEVAALGRVVSEDRSPERPCRLGSVKTNIGHTEAAAGIAGLIKVALSLKHGALPPNLHYQEANPHIPFHALPLVVQNELTPWPTLPGEKALAGVSSFGFGGTNAHVVLEEFADTSAIQKSARANTPGRPDLLVLSAQTPEALQELAAAHRELAAAEVQAGIQEAALDDICFTAGARRDHHDHRLAVVANGKDELRECLTAFLSGESRPGLAVGHAPHHRRRTLAFVFPGQGGQWVGMGRQLLAAEPVFRQALERIDALFLAEAGWSLVQELQSDDDVRLQQTEVTQPLLFAVQVAVAELWRAWGVHPDAVVGHSMGEVAAAYIAGALSLEDAVRIIHHRGRVMRHASGKGKMAAAELTVEEAKALLEEGGFAGRLSIAAVNGPHSLVLSGDAEAVEEILPLLEARGVFVRALAVDLASHSPHMEELQGELERALMDIEPRWAWVPIYSTVTGALCEGSEFDAFYWGRNLRQTVRFEAALGQMLADEYTLFVEVSPHNVLTAVIRTALQAQGLSGAALPSLRRREDEFTVMLTTLGALYAHGVPIAWHGLYPEGRLVTLPLYPWQRERFWIDLPEEEAAAELWPSVAEAAARQAEQAPLDLNLATYGEQQEWLDELTTAYVLRTLREMGFFAAAGETRTAAEIGGPHEKLLVRWLNRLAKSGLLVQNGASYTSVAPLPAPDFESLWERGGDTDTPFHDYLRRSGENLGGVLRGEVNPLELFFPEGSFATTEYIYQHSAEARYYNAVAASAARALAASTPARRPLRILEIGAGTGSTAASVLPALPAGRSKYVFTDLSDLFLTRAQRKFAPYPFVDYRLLNIEQDPAAQGFEPHAFDLIVAANVLHATQDLRETLTHVRSLLAPGGVLLLWEVTDHISWFDITFGTIDGWGRHADDVRTDNPLLPTETWRDTLLEHGFEEVLALPAADSAAAQMGQHILLALADGSGTAQAAHFDDDLANPADADLADRRPAPAEAGAGASEDSLLPALLTLAESERLPRIADYLQHRTAHLLGLSPHRLDSDQPLSMLGLDSLMAVELRNAILQNLGVTVPVALFLQGASTNALAAEVHAQLGTTLAAASAAASQAPVHQIVADPAQRHEPFPLNDIQQAYWIGRSGALELGNVSTQLYLEFEAEQLDLPRLTRAWNALIARHDMLRAVVHPSGEQQILPTVPSYEIITHDLTEKSASAASARLAAVRDEMAHTVRTADAWPLFDIRAHHLPGGKTRLHLTLDFLIADAASLLILFREWGQLYADESVELPPLTLTFRDYVLAEIESRGTDLYRRDLAYWQERLPTLPPAPELPLAKSPDSLAKPHFARRETELDAATWTRLKARAASLGLTPSMVLCAAYAEVLRTWSKTPRFTINLTMFNRQPLHPDVNAVVGDFTSLNLLEVDHSETQTFEDRARTLQAQLLADLEHNRVSGVAVLREWAREHGKGMGAPMPVVFTSVLEDFHQHLSWLGELVGSLSQTPQVWLDHQVLERDGALYVIWDAVEDLFPPGLLADMFAAYQGLLQRLGTDEAAWTSSAHPLLPQAQLDQRLAVNATAAPIPPGLLQEPFLQQAALRPHHPAVIAPERTLTYDDLVRRANRLGRLLRARGVRPNQLVAVVMEKGWEQIVAVLGILQAGGAYLPIDPHVPADRLQDLLEQGEAGIALTQPRFHDALTWPTAVEVVGLEDEELLPYDDAPLALIQQPDDLAYVIFTSGSTGRPKGVMIDHQGALNTCLDLNERFEVGPEDRVLALAALNFDLSVYDIFGLLAAGGTVVLPEPSAVRDPARWAELLRTERITIWNSVPALMNLLADFEETAQTAPQKEDSSLRLVLLSGDWIPLSLPPRIRTGHPAAAVYSLGGATEASIWSILYPIGDLDPTWKSIPYGRPMVNQTFHVLNDALEPCPTYVPGQLFIGGIGLAKGYWKDAEKTAASFLLHPETGERLYRTGDLGRWLPDGTIEFLGREDFQVKVQGYRIELGEIEHALLQHEAIRTAVVQAAGDMRGDKRLVAYLVPDPDHHGPPPDAAELRDFLKKRLPSYMIPTVFRQLDSLPLSANGKIDRKALPEPDFAADDAHEHVAPRTPLEITLADIFSDLLGLAPGVLGVHDNLFALGANSLHTIQSVVRLHRTGHIVNAQTIFENQTIFELAHAIEEAPQIKRERAHDSTPQQEVVNAPSLPLMAEVPNHILLTGATGYLGAHLLHRLLTETTATLHLLLRATSPAQAEARLLEHLKHHFPALDPAAYLPRLQFHLGDLTLPSLGLSADEFAALADTVDAIYHSAAKVDHFGDPALFHAHNVDGTRRVLALAEKGKPKRFHHISTIGVRGINPDLPTFRETDHDLGQTFDTRYAESKWHAERHILDAIARGIPANIYRLGFVAADEPTGIYQRNIEDNALYRYIRSTLHLGLAPYLPTVPLDFVPVDFITKAILALAQQPDTVGETFHLLHPEPLAHYDVMRTFQALGYSIRLLNPDDFQATVFTLGTPEDQTELEGLVGFQDASRAQIFHVDSECTQRRLTELGLRYPEITPAYLTRMVRHAIDVGYFKAPPYWDHQKGALPALLTHH